MHLKKGYLNLCRLLTKIKYQKAYSLYAFNKSLD